MPRINVEESIWSDPRLHVLQDRVGRHLALGYLLSAWHLAQRYWNGTFKPIPEEIWVVSGLPEDLIISGLAKRREDGIYVSGSEEHFAWHQELYKTASVAGRASARARKEKYGSSDPRANHRTDAERVVNGRSGPVNGVGTPVNGRERSTSSSYSCSSKGAEKNNNEETGVQKNTEVLKDHRFKEILEKALATKHLPRQIEEGLAKIEDRFKSYEPFRSWLKDLMGAFEDKKIPEARLKAYVYGALNREVGL